MALALAYLINELCPDTLLTKHVFRRVKDRMRLVYDRDKITGPYDERNLTISASGKHRYPSKKMFIEFLKQFKDVRGVAEIWSEENWTTGTVTIHVEVTYKVADVK